MDISVIIPCYNSENSLEELVGRIYTAFVEGPEIYEIIIVNDCSKDNSLKVLKKLSREFDNLKVVDLMFNVGQFRALMCGLSYSTGDLVVTMDDDLQHPPEEIYKLIDAIRADDDLDAIFGKPEKKAHRAYRNIGSFVIGWVNRRIFMKPKDLTMSAFRVMRRELVDTLLCHRTMYPIMGPLILKSTTRIRNIEVVHDPRKHGQSNYSLIKLIRTTIDNVINFSSLPLKWISGVGLTVFGGSVLLIIYYLIRYALGGIGVQGWATNVILINLYGGLILFSIGIIGEYLIRIIYEVQESPRYRVRRVYGQDDK